MTNKQKSIQEESIRELKAMKLSPDVIRKFYETGVIMVADDKQYREPLEDELEILNDFKTQHPTWFPYLAVRIPQQLAIFAVTPDEAEWPRIRQELAFLGMGEAYIHDFSSKKSYGFFHIDFQIEDGLIIRTDDGSETVDIIRAAHCPINELEKQIMKTI